MDSDTPRTTQWCRKAAVIIRRALVVPLMAVTAVVLATCAPMPDADDEGHATFARESIKLLLGRPARGADEVEVVADIAKLVGRDVALRMLMKDTEYVDTWAENLVDLLQIQREAGSGLAAQDQACWGTPTRANPDPAIATWVRDHGPTDGGAPAAWNMSDLLRSAIAIDDLSPVYRAHLFTLSMRRQSSNSTDEVTTRFMRTYLNRDLTCLRCHNPTFSASNKTDAGGNIVWQRTWTIPGHPEKALFGNYFDAATALNGLRQVMRGDVRKPASGAFGIRPWGIEQSCAMDSGDGGPENSLPASHEGFQTLAGTNPGAAFGSLNGAASPAALFELEAALRTGINDLKDGYERFPAVNPILPPDQQLYCDAVTVFASNCVGCHNPPGPPGGLDLSTNDPAGQLINVDTNALPKPPNLAKRVVPSDTVHSELWRRIVNDIMPPGGLPVAPPGTERPALENWITGGAPHTVNTNNCNTSTIPDVDPNEALAFLTASNLVDGIWMADMGYRLTIDNGFARNRQQRDMLWNLTEYEFLPASWSLKAVLGKIMASNWYARRAPAISQNVSAYNLPPIVNPWIVADPTVVSNPHARERYNGQGELVDRFRVNTLLRNIGAALAWKKPRRFPGGGYPSPFDANLGQYISPQSQGFRGINFQSLLALETETGLCNKSGRAVGGDDWVDSLVDGILAHNTANPGAPITMGEAWSMLKDRLIQDPSINITLPSGLAAMPGAKTEQQAVVAFLNTGLSVPGGMSLDTSTGAVTAVQLSAKLRQGCGIVVKSPQFLLTNVTPRTYSDNNMPGPPRLNVCMPGESCGYAQACGYWRQTLLNMGQRIACMDRSVRRSFRIRFLDDLDLVATIDPHIRATWFVLARRTGSESTVPIDLVGTKRMPSKGKLDFDLIKNLRIDEPEKAGKGLDRVQQRLTTLCPGGLCGFFKRAASDIDRCLKSPKESACEAAQALCDPRSSAAPNSCGSLPADLGESGVLALWAEGAEVRSVSGAQILRPDSGRWLPLDAGGKLKTGDLVYLPLKGSLRLQADNLVFGDEEMEESEVSGVRGHMLAITGASAEKMLGRALKRGTMSPDVLRSGVESGAFDSRAMTKENLKRALDYAVLPQHVRTPTLKEIIELNRDFDALNRGMPVEKPKDGKD